MASTLPDRAHTLWRTRASSRGFTLVEMLIALTISGMLLGAIFSSVFYFTKSGIAISGYFEMEEEHRKTSQVWSRDVFNSTDAQWQNSNHLTLESEDGDVEYLHDPVDGELLRKEADGAWQVLVSGIGSLRFIPYNRAGVALDLSEDLNAANQGVKMIQLEVASLRDLNLQPNVSSQWVTPRVTLRNRTVETP